MNIFFRILRKIEFLRSQHYIRKQKNILANQIRDRRNTKRIFYFCPPTHSNLGDQAQYFCWLRLFEEWHPGYEVICVPQEYSTPATIQLIKNYVQADDLIYIHSGYLIFDPHPELHFLCNVVDSFKDRQITILPQTVNLLDDRMQRYVSDCFNSHPNLTLLCRDEISLDKAQKLFTGCRLKLMPDVVTSLIGNREFYYEHDRDGILFCVRNDDEKLYTTEQIDELRERFNGIKTRMCDTTIEASIWKWDRNREALIRSMLERFARFQLIITDRYHGTIFSQIENTPVIVLSSTDHKLSSGVNWFPKDLFSDNMHFARSLEEAYDLAQVILSRKGHITFNTTYFKDNYYSKRPQL